MADRSLPLAKWEPPPEIRSATERTRPSRPDTLLGRVSIELRRVCNLRCSYCYSRAGTHASPGLDDADIRALISEAVECGAVLVSIVGGGETLLRRSLLMPKESCIDFANGLGAYCYLYTNGTLLDDRAAAFLYERDVSVVAKLNSLRPEVQDELTGVVGSAAAMYRGIDCLLAHGFATPSKGSPKTSRLALETIICRQNYDEMPTLWRFMRDRGIVPEVEIPTIQGRARDNAASLYFGPEEASEKYRVLFEELLRIDRSEYGFDWVIHPPFPAGSCKLFYSNCYVNDRGGVQPCAGIDVAYGTLRVGPNRGEGRPLAEILASGDFQKLRHVHDHLAVRCGGCELRAHCYGCRGAAWNATGDIFADDPVCWLKPASP